MNDFVFSMMLLGALSSGGTTPFWAVSNQGGIMPESSGALALVQAYKPFDESKTFQWKAGASLAANWQPNDPLNPSGFPVHAMVDELYAGARWKVLRAEIGMLHRERDFQAADPRLGSLSVTEGHIIESNNARAMPGYSLILEPWSIPFTKGHLQISGLWGDYKTLDDRYIDGTLVHRIRGIVRYDSRRHFYIQVGLDHYALWGGTPPEGSGLTPMAVTFDNYLRICTGRSASSAGSKSDRMNCLGDHGGAEQLRMGWRFYESEVTFQYEKPYSDKSGMRFNNIPDGVYTLSWSRKDKEAWLTDALVEFHYTMWQSGTIHESETDAAGNQLDWKENKNLNIFGMDNYFTNGEYRSAWTHFGRCIGGPLFLTDYNSSGVKSVRNNRYMAIHLGLSGRFFRKAPYRLMVTLSDNYGSYSWPYISPSSANSGWNWWERNTIDKGLKQLSAGFSGFIPFRLTRRSSIDAVYGIYVDFGDLLGKNYGATLGVRYNL